MTRRAVRTLAAVAALWFAAQLLLQPAAQAQVVDANDTSSDTANFTQTNSTGEKRFFENNVLKYLYHIHCGAEMVEIYILPKTKMETLQ